MKRKTAFLLIGIYVFCSGFGAFAAEPVFCLDFRDGLTADVTIDGKVEQTEGRWHGDNPPLYYEGGLSGPALLITDDPATASRVSFSAPESTTDSGTLMFWSRGLENWDIWGRGHNRNLWPTSNFFWTSGEGGGVMVYKWSWYGAVTYLLMAPGGNQAVATWPVFNQYEWTQIGLSWQKEADGSSRVRFYLNGELGSEISTVFPFNGFSIGGNTMQKGGRRVLDNLKVWDYVMTDSEIKRVYRHDLGLLNSPVVAVPYLDEPPSIDGRIDAAEWQRASSVTGMLDVETGELAEDGSVFYLGYDEDFLYIAMKGEMTELARTDPAAVIETFLRSQYTGRTPDVETDDTVEIILSPGYWQSEGPGAPDGWQEYRVITNSEGGYSSSAYSLSGRDDGWDARVESASSVSGQGWEFEARIPLERLGSGGSLAGGEWGLQLGRRWQHLKEEHNVWTWGKRHAPESRRSIMYPPEEAPPVPYQPDSIRYMHMHAHDGFTGSNMGRLLFLPPGSPVVRVGKTGALSDNQVDFAATLYNPADKEIRLDIRLFTDSGELSLEESVSILPDGEKVYELAHYISDFSTSSLNFEVYDPAGTLLHRTSVPFYLEQSFGVDVKQMPNFERLLVQLDLGIFSSVPVDEIRVDLEISDLNGRTLYTLADRDMPAYFAVIEGSTGTIGFEPCILTVSVRHGDTVLAVEELDFVKTPQAPWWDNSYGFDDMDNDKVPYPWTDMTVSEDTLGVWGRQYRFGGSLLPGQVTTLGDEILRAPMRLLLKTSDGLSIDTSRMEPEVEWTRKDRTRVEGVRTVGESGVTVSNSFWAEYDGLVWNNLTVDIPKGSDLELLRIELPLTREFTDVIKAGGHHNTGELKPEGYKGRDNVWLGNGNGGIQFFPSTKVHVGDRRATMSVDVEDGVATMGFTAVDIPLQLDKPLEIEFGFIATPMRPKIWRTPEFRAGSVRGGGPFYPPGLEALPAADPGHAYYGGGGGGNLYVWTASISTAKDASCTEDFKYYGAEWMADPFQRPRAHWNTMVVNPINTESFRDWFVWRYWRYQNKYGYRGLYYDNPNLGTMGNRDIMKRLYNITLSNGYYAAREQMIGLASNGIYNMAFSSFFTYQWNGENLNSVLGAMDTYRGILDPGVFRAEYMGHNFAWPARLLGQSRVRPEAAEAVGGIEAVIDHVDGLVLLHDTALPYMMPCCITRGGRARISRNGLARAIEKHNFYHWKYQFTPYWQQDIVELPGEGMYASFYAAHPSRLVATDPLEHMNRNRVFRNYFTMSGHMPDHIIRRFTEEIESERRYLESMEDKVIMVVYNDTGWEGEMRLKPDWDKIGLGGPDTLKAENAVHAPGFPIVWEEDSEGNEVQRILESPDPPEYARIEGDEIVFPMTEYNYRMIVFRKR